MHVRCSEERVVCWKCTDYMCADRQDEMRSKLMRKRYSGFGRHPSKPMKPRGIGEDHVDLSQEASVAQQVEGFLALDGAAQSRWHVPVEAEVQNPESVRRERPWGPPGAPHRRMLENMELESDDWAHDAPTPRGNAYGAELS